MALFVQIFKSVWKQRFKVYFFFFFFDNLGGIQEPNGAHIQVRHLDYKILII